MLHGFVAFLKTENYENCRLSEIIANQLFNNDLLYILYILGKPAENLIQEQTKDNSLYYVGISVPTLFLILIILGLVIYSRLRNIHFNIQCISLS